MPRLFIALEPPEAVKSAVLEAVAHLKRSDALVRWADRGHLHVTVRFLGEVPKAAIPAISAMLLEACRESAPFHVEVRGLGTFGGRTPRVVWAGVIAPSEDAGAALHHLQRRVDEGAAALGFPSDRQGFVAHLTLGRVKTSRGADDLREAVSQHAEKGFGRFEARELVLFQSSPGPSGSVYTPLLRAPLRGGRGSVPPGS